MRAIAVESTEDMLLALEKEFPKADALFMAAAPADFRPVEQKTQKIKGLDDGKIRTCLLYTSNALYMEPCAFPSPDAVYFRII